MKCDSFRCMVFSPDSLFEFEFRTVFLCILLQRLKSCSLIHITGLCSWIRGFRAEHSNDCQCDLMQQHVRVTIATTQTTTIVFPIGLPQLVPDLALRSSMLLGQEWIFVGHSSAVKGFSV